MQMKYAKKVSRIGNLAHVFALPLQFCSQHPALLPSRPRGHLLAVSDSDAGREALAAGKKAVGGVIERNALDLKPCGSPGGPPKGAPNILLNLTDDVGFGAPRTFGGLIRRRPSID